MFTKSQIKAAYYSFSLNLVRQNKLRSWKTSNCIKELFCINLFNMFRGVRHVWVQNPFTHRKCVLPITENASTHTKNNNNVINIYLKKT